MTPPAPILGYPEDPKSGHRATKTLRKWEDDAKQKPGNKPTPKAGTRIDR